MKAQIECPGPVVRQNTEELSRVLTSIKQSAELTIGVLALGGLITNIHDNEK